MAQAGVQLQGAVLHTGAAELLIRPAHAVAAVTHRILFAGDEQHRDAGIHLPQVAELLVEADARQHLPEQTHRGVGAAQGIGHVGVHVVLVGGQPVAAGAVGGKQLVVGAEGQIRHQIAGAVLAHHGAHGLGDGHAAGDDRLGLPAGTHDDGGLHGAGVADEVGASQERPHAVAHDAQRHIGIPQADALVQDIDVVHHRVPCVALAEIDGGAALQQGQAVAQVVVTHHRDAKIVEIAGEGVIACDMLRHTVADLKDGADAAALRLPAHTVELRFPVGGQEGEFGHIRHGNPAPFVV